VFEAPSGKDLKRLQAVPVAGLHGFELTRLNTHGAVVKPGLLAEPCAADWAALSAHPETLATDSNPATRQAKAAKVSGFFTLFPVDFCKLLFLLAGTKRA
jgi:hypothetical protein